MSLFVPLTNDFVTNRISSEGEACEVVVCEKHGKRFLLDLYLKAPLVKDPCPKKARMTEDLKLLEEPHGGAKNDDLHVAITAPVVAGEEDGEGTTVLVGTEHNPKCHEVHRSQERSSSLQSENETWAWF